MNRDFDNENYWQEQFQRQDLWQTENSILRRQVEALQQRVNELEERARSNEPLR